MAWYWRVGTGVAMALAIGAGEGRAQIPNCGTTGTSLRVFQEGTGPRVGLIARTARQITGCLQSVQVEAWVRGAGTASVHRDTYTAEVFKGVEVGSYGRWAAESKHWLIQFWQWINLGTLIEFADLVPPPLPAPEEECAQLGGEWADGTCQWLNSPILIDTARNGYRLTSVEEGVRFDLDADGIPERIAWTHPGSDDAWLALDRNGNGVIDNGRELFGNFTPAYADAPEPRSANGFEALLFTEGPGYGVSRLDRRISADDAIFGRLLLWRDLNHNGLSEPDELQAASDAGLLAISTDYQTSGRRDRHGNEFRLRAPSWWVDGDGRRTARPVFDVWLKTDR